MQPLKEEVAQALFDHIPVGVGGKGIIPVDAKTLDTALEMASIGVFEKVTRGLKIKNDAKKTEEC